MIIVTHWNDINVIIIIKYSAAISLIDRTHYFTRTQLATEGSRDTSSLRFEPIIFLKIYRGRIKILTLVNRRSLHDVEPSNTNCSFSASRWPSYLLIKGHYRTYRSI